MVTILNRYNLPDTIVRATRAINAKYDKGNVHRSVTQLVNPPRIDMLRKRHYHEITEDVSDMWWSVFGSAVHYVLEQGRGPKHVTEERVFTRIIGWDISGQADLQDNSDGSVSLMDYKVTTAFVVQKNEEKAEWEQQLNMLAYLIWLEKGVRVKDVSVIAFVRDWTRSQTVDPTYPPCGIVRLPMPLWTVEEQRHFIEHRITVHRMAELQMEIGVPLPHCTREERWQKDDRFAVKKPESKKALKVYDLQEAAEADIAKRKPGYIVEVRPGKSFRCSGNFCQVAPWCDQWQAIKDQDENETEQEQA